MSDPNTALQNRWYVSEDGVKTCKHCATREAQPHRKDCPYEALAMMERRVIALAQEAEAAQPSEQRPPDVEQDALDHLQPGNRWR